MKQFILFYFGQNSEEHKIRLIGPPLLKIFLEYLPILLFGTTFEINFSSNSDI